MARHVNYDQALNCLIDCYRGDGKLLLCGNGGSSADSAHIAGELLKGFLKKRPLSPELRRRIGEEWALKLQAGLPAIDLTAHGALISAVANDLDAANVFAQQVIAYGRAGDVLIGISTSGNSENVLRACITARALGMKVIALTGRQGGKLREQCDILLNVDETETYKVQEKHLQLYHRLCADVEATFFEV